MAKRPLAYPTGGVSTVEGFGARPSITQWATRAAGDVHAWRTAVLVGVALRLVWWALLPADRFADYSDEVAYYHSGLKLYRDGIQDLYWPPMAGWLVALAMAVSGSTSIRVIRLLWVTLDATSLALLARLVPNLVGGRASRGDRRLRTLVTFSTLCYALYLPAVMFSCITTTEVPAVLFLLLGLVFLGDWTSIGAARALAGGLAFGLMGLARVSLLTTIPLAALYMLWRRGGGRRTIVPLTVFCAAALLPLGTWMSRNRVVEGRWVVADYGYRDLYDGNNPVYQNDLDLLHPLPTREQIAKRQELAQGKFRSVNPDPTELDTMRGAALAFIAEHPLLFVRRVFGRLARMFCPKNNVLAIVGRGGGLATPAKVPILGVTVVEEAFVLFLGLAGWLRFRRRVPETFRLVAILAMGCLTAGSLTLASPRYSFPLVPVLTICAVSFAVELRANWRALRADRLAAYGYVALATFFLWGWIASAIWAFGGGMSSYM